MNNGTRVTHRDAEFDIQEQSPIHAIFSLFLYLFLTSFRVIITKHKSEKNPYGTPPKPSGSLSQYSTTSYYVHPSHSILLLILITNRTNRNRRLPPHRNPHPRSLQHLRSLHPRLFQAYSQDVRTRPSPRPNSKSNPCSSKSKRLRHDQFQKLHLHPLRTDHNPADRYRVRRRARIHRIRPRHRSSDLCILGRAP